MRPMCIIGLWAKHCREYSAAAVVRETREEVGMQVHLGKVAGVYCNPDHPERVIVVYMAKPASGHCNWREWSVVCREAPGAEGFASWPR